MADRIEFEENSDGEIEIEEKKDDEYEKIYSSISSLGIDCYGLRE